MVLIATGLASFVLFALHPGSAGHDFDGILRSEAARADRHACRPSHADRPLQSFAVAAWGWAMIASGASCGGGVVAFVIRIALVVAFAGNVAAANEIVPMAAIAGIAVWALVAGAVLMQRA